MTDLSAGHDQIRAAVRLRRGWIVTKATVAWTLEIDGKATTSTKCDSFVTALRASYQGSARP
jgi:hypothetical protein